MIEISKARLRTLAFLGASAVALGAFGAHALNETLLQSGRLETWKTASLYHLAHTLFLLLTAILLPKRTLTFQLGLAGILLFSGSLYLLCITNITLLGAITPIGGLLLTAAWISLAFQKNTLN